MVITRDRRGVVRHVELDGIDLTQYVRALEVLFTAQDPVPIVRVDFLALVAIRRGGRSRAGTRRMTRAIRLCVEGRPCVRGAQTMPLWGEADAVWAYVDDIDYDRLSQIHWHLSGGYAYSFDLPSGHRAMHLVVVGRGSFTGDGSVVDHRNGDPLDNRRCNLHVIPDWLNRINTKRFRARREALAMAGFPLRGPVTAHTIVDPI